MGTKISRGYLQNLNPCLKGAYTARMLYLKKNDIPQSRTKRPTQCRGKAWAVRVPEEEQSERSLSAEFLERAKAEPDPVPQQGPMTSMSVKFFITCRLANR